MGRDRLDRSANCSLEGLADEIILGQAFLPSSANGNHGQHHVESAIRLRQKGLLPWQTSFLADLSSGLPDAEAALLDRRALLFLGYVYAFACRMKRPVDAELMEFHRKEQLSRLKCLFVRLLKTGRLELHRRS